MDYKVPGVYVEEISTLPPSVAGVATAIPAFVGFTEKAIDRNDSSHPKEEIVVKRIDTFLEYEQYFGKKPKLSRFNLEKNGDRFDFKRKKPTGNDNAGDLPSHLMYYAVRMYFDNGGGSCYIVSAARYNANAIVESSIDSSDSESDLIKKGIEKLKEYDEPTLIVLPDAINLNESDYYARCGEVLNQCNLLKDRFGLFDVLKDDTDASKFREGIGNNYLKYGAAYMPYLKTTLTYKYLEEDVEIGNVFWQYQSDATGNTGIKILFPDLNAAANPPQIHITEDGDDLSFEVKERVLTISGVGTEGAKVDDIITAWNAFKGDKGDFSIEKDSASNGEEIVSALSDAAALNTDGELNLASIKDTFTQLYNQFKTALSQQRVILPPSSAMAGIYASVDRDRGVWKAPANVSISSLIEPISKITNADQSRLNVDPTSGKSINVIRSFTGRGTLVWGARTLAGNDNEWRYINVRRLFIYMEESIQKATAFVVFEPNTATTWLKVKGLIESFLYGLWQQGALAGPTPEAAYFVNVGLGKTMTPQDILEGRLIVEVGVAAARPAEFVILRFMHKLQEA